MKAVICPVCNGKGQLENPLTPEMRKNCHGCEGLGWVEVGEDSYLIPQPGPVPQYPNIPWYPIYPNIVPNQYPYLNITWQITPYEQGEQS